MDNVSTYLKDIIIIISVTNSMSESNEQCLWYSGFDFLSKLWENTKLSMLWEYVKLCIVNQSKSLIVIHLMDKKLQKMWKTSSNPHLWGSLENVSCGVFTFFAIITELHYHLREREPPILSFLYGRRLMGTCRFTSFGVANFCQLRVKTASGLGRPAVGQ